MKRIKNADINFKLNPKRINLNNFSMKFYTVNSEAYFFIKDQDNVVSVEREATIYDDPEVIISGGTVAVDYYLPLDWSELVQLGEGVLNYRCINNIEDPFFPDLVYNQVVEDTTAYYIDSDIHIDPADDKNLIERVVELESNLAVETADREDADVFLSGAVDTEIARAISAETELSERIDEIESGASEALDAEIERAISAETALQDAIDDEEARAIAIENAIRQDLTDESEIRSSADTAMWTAINDEIVRSTSAETAIDNKVEVETLRAIGVENAISGDLQTYKATNNAALQAETTRATSAETALQSAINDEATARANADTALGTRIDNISSASTAAIESEAARAQEAESGLTNAINNEVTRATSAETIIANSLNAEINRASSAETALNNQIDAEVLRATAREAELEAKIGVVSGVTELINAETLRATTAENALDEKIGNVSGSVISEETRAISAETALDNKINTVSGNVLTEEARAKGVEDVLSGAIDTLDVRFFDNAKYENSGNTKVINFYNAGVVKATIDATDFIKDGMISTVELVQSGTTSVLVITWNTDAGSQVTTIDVGDIFEADNYYTKSETSGATEISTALAQKLAISDFNTYSGAVDTAINSKASQTDLNTLSGTVTGHTSDSTIHLTSGNVQTQIDNSISGKADSSDVYLKSETSGATELATAFAATQPKLSAGTNITIDANNVISAEGGGKAVSAGTNISITTGETADTINCTLPYYRDSKDCWTIYGYNNSYANSSTNTTNSAYIGFNNVINGTSSLRTTFKNIIIGFSNKLESNYTEYFMGGNFIIGENNTLSGANNIRESYVIGKYNKGYGIQEFICGWNNEARNTYETSFGYKNISTSGAVTFGYSGNTLFSIGNGNYFGSDKHNAFEIRQNGDIYIADVNDTSTSNYWEKPMIKLQDALSSAGGGITSGEVQTMITSATTPIYQTIEDNEQVTAQALNVLNGELANKLDVSAYTPTDLSNYYTKSETSGATEISTALSNKLDASAYTPTDLSNYYTKSETSGATELATAFAATQPKLSAGTNITIVDNVISATGGGGGGKAIEAGRGISVTTGETADTVSFNLPISAGTGTNSIVEGYNTKASGHSSHAEGYNTIAKGSQAHSEGRSTTASGAYSHAEGENTYAGGSKSHTEGSYTEANNEAEHASGRFNVSSKADTTFGDSGNTLFSVGNGTSTSARHNAFEVRQNGDIYISSGGTDIKLQDHLGGGGGGITIDPSLDSGSTNAVANSAITTAINSKLTDIIRGTADWAGSGVTTLNVTYNGTNETTRTFCASINNKQILTGSDYSRANKFSLVETSAITTSVTSSSTDSQVPSAKAVNDKLGGLSLVKLTQSEYDALATKDNNTLYVIVG